MPLEQQEKMLDEEEEEEMEGCEQQGITTTSSNMARPSLASNNVTLFVPDMDDFARMAMTASTPFTGQF